ncbi:uncharacterized protein [Branchiostoma lanceolatum]|uniref:uncharacterized protein n=1 Tax=Branchiostoma lanceolatum TaxID=7740 RepID=UPI0034533328
MCKNNGHAMFGLGVTLVVLGSLSTILGIAAAAAFPLDVYSRISGPIWAGAFVVITGVMGIMAGRNFGREGASTGFTPAFLTLSIIGILVALSQVSVSSAAVSIFGTCFVSDLVQGVQDALNNNDDDGYNPFVTTPSYNWNWDFNVHSDQDSFGFSMNPYCTAAVGLHYTCLALGLLEMILCFVSSVVGCVVGCTCCSPQPGPSVVVMQPSNLAYAQMPPTVSNPAMPGAYPQAGYIQQLSGPAQAGYGQQPGGPPPAYLPPPGQQSPAYPGPIDQAVHVKAQPV